jgi:hypothetical protein
MKLTKMKLKGDAWQCVLTGNNGQKTVATVIRRKGESLGCAAVRIEESLRRLQAGETKMWEMTA